MTNETLDMVNLISVVKPLIYILFILVPVVHLVHLVYTVGIRIRSHDSHLEESTPRPKPLVPSKAIEKMLKTISGEEIPEWVETLGKYEKQGVQTDKIQKNISKMEDVFQKEVKQFNENFTEFQGLKVKDDASLILDLTGRLKKQKELVLELGQEILALRIQDETVNNTFKADKLAKKMDKELSGQVDIERVRETVSETVPSVEEQVLRTILSSTEASVDLKERAEKLLPQFKGVTKEERKQEMINQDFEIDLQTLERILDSRVALGEKEEIK